MAVEIEYVPPEIEGSVPSDIMKQARAYAADGAIYWKVQVVQSKFSLGSTPEYRVVPYRNQAPQSMLMSEQDHKKAAGNR